MFDSQDVLTEPKHWEKVLAIIPDDGVQASLRSEWEKSPNRDPSKKWEDLKDAIGSAIAAVRIQKRYFPHNVTQRSSTADSNIPDAFY